jgi:hypothetical protein
MLGDSNNGKGGSEVRTASRDRRSGANAARRGWFGRAGAFGRADAIGRAVTETLEGRQLMADVAGAGGLVANYYADANFQNLVAARTDATIDFDWGTGSPAAGVPAEGFSARWTGQVSAAKAGKYKLTADSAGGMKVVVGGQTVIDDSAPHTRRSVSGTFKFAAGEYYDLTVEFQDTGAAAARLLWAKPGGAQTVVPQENLYRLGTGWVTGGWTTDAAGTLSSTGDSFALTAPAAAPKAAALLSTLAAAAAPAAADDYGQLAYKTLRGDGEIVVKLDSLSAGAEANVVFRNTAEGGAEFVDLSVQNGQAFLESRATADAAVVTSASTAVDGPVFLKLHRDGNSFAGYVSATGADGTWALVGTAGSFMDTFAQVGFGVDGTGTFTPASSPTASSLAASPLAAKATTASATFAAAAVSAKPQLGANLHHLYDSSTERPFVDILKMNGGFQLPSGAPAPVDANGWPTVSEFQVFVGGAGIPAGRYTIAFTGPASASVASKRAGTTVTKGSYNAATGEHIWYADVAAGQPNTGFTFKGFTGWGKNLRVLQPGYSPVNTPIYTDRYLNFIKAYSPASLRFMDWVKTNDLTITQWSERSTATTANWAKRGVAWEAAIELCNQVGANLYINVPGRANDDYVRQLATLVRTKLRADLNVYVEQGNEMWATNFANGKWNYQTALEEVQAAKKAGGQSVLNYDNKPVNTTQTDIYAGGATTWAFRKTARRAKQIGDIFKQVWLAAGQPDPTNTRVRVMVAAQVANLSTYDVMLKFLNDVYGTPSKYIYSMAAAPYFTMGKYNDKLVNGKWTTLKANATAADLLGTMAASSGAYAQVSKWNSFAAHGSPYGVKLAMYEGGHDTFGPFNIQAKKQATLSPQMKGMMKGYLSTFFASGGTVFHYYTLGVQSYDGPYGTWAITNDFNNTNTPKSVAFKEVRQGVGLANVSAVTAPVFA